METATALQQCALDLFLSRGYEETTVQDITEAAGVSPRTFFRYYPTKDAVLLTENTRREEALRAFLASRPEESIAAFVDAAVDHLVDDVQQREALVRVQRQAFFTVPVLADRFAGHHDRLIEIISAHVAGLVGLRDGHADPRPHLVASLVVRTWTTSITMWLAGDTADDLHTLAVRALRTARTDPDLVGQPA